MRKDFTFELSPSKVNSLAYSIGNGSYHSLYYTTMPGKYSSKILDSFMFLSKHDQIYEHDALLSFNKLIDTNMSKDTYNTFNVLSKKQNIPNDNKFLSNKYKNKFMNIRNDMLNIDFKTYKNVYYQNSIYAKRDDPGLLIANGLHLNKTSISINDNSYTKTVKKAYDSSKINIADSYFVYKNINGALVNEDVKTHKTVNNKFTIYDNIYLNSHNASIKIIDYELYLYKYNNGIHIFDSILLKNGINNNLYMSKDYMELDKYYNGIYTENTDIHLSKHYNGVYTKNTDMNLSKHYNSILVINESYLLNKNNSNAFIYNSDKIINKNNIIINYYNDYINLYKHTHTININNDNITARHGLKGMVSLKDMLITKDTFRTSFEGTNQSLSKISTKLFNNTKNDFVYKAYKDTSINTILYIKKYTDGNSTRRLFYQNENIFISKKIFDLRYEYECELITKSMHNFQYQYNNSFISKNMHNFQYQYDNTFASKKMHDFQYQYQDYFISKNMHFMSYQYEDYFINKYNKPIVTYANVTINKYSKPIVTYNSSYIKKNSIDIFKNQHYELLSKNPNPITLNNNITINENSKAINMIENIFINTNDKPIDIMNNFFIKYIEDGIYFDEGFILDRERKPMYEDNNIRIDVPLKNTFYNVMESIDLDRKHTYINDVIDIKKDIKEVFIDYDNLFVHVIHYDPEGPKTEYKLTGKTDELILPHNDFKYETYLPKLIENDGTVNPRYIKAFDTTKNRYTVSIPVENPIDIYAAIGREYLDLDTGILECIIRKVKDIWKKNMYKYIVMFAPDALKDIMNILFDYITEIFVSKNEYDQAIRCLQLFRWYAEMAVLNNCDYDMYFDSKTIKIDYYNKDLADLDDIIILNNMDIDDSYLLESLDTTKPCNIIFKNTKKGIVPTLYLHMRLYNINGKSSISIIEDEKLISETIYDAGIHELDLELKDKIIIIFDPTEDNQNMAIANASVLNYPEDSFNVLYKGRFGDINNVMQELLNELKIYNNVTSDVRNKFRNISPTTVAIDTLIKYFETHHENKDKGKRLITKK